MRRLLTKRTEWKKLHKLTNPADTHYNNNPYAHIKNLMQWAFLFAANDVHFVQYYTVQYTVK